MATKKNPGGNVTEMPAATGDQYLKAQEVADLLRIKLQTLYVYVSRGLVRRIRSDQHRGFLYLREDVESLGKRGRSKIAGSAAKSGAPFWSQPVVRTSITEIKPDGPCYRGLAAVDLANSGEKFENVAEMIWTGWLSEDPLLWGVAQPGKLQVAVLQALQQEARLARVDPIRKFSMLVASLAASEAGSDDIREGTTIASARALLRLLAEVADAPESDLALLSSRSFTLSAESHYQKAISKSVQHLVANFRDEIRLEDLLKISGLSRPTFARQFKQHSGHSFSAFVNELRLQAARRELRDRERSVLDIALACGFRQVTFFNRLFKREMGCTPVEYRRKQRRKGR